MSQRLQKKYFETLRRYERKFDSKESEMYKMFLKRHKDDEDLDQLSMEKLKELYEKYYVNRERKNYDDLFKSGDIKSDESQPDDTHSDDTHSDDTHSDDTHSDDIK